MNKIIFVLLLASSLALPAQETRHETTHSLGAAIDHKPNSPAVPDVIALSGHFQRVVVLRFKFDTDLLAGLRQMIAQQHIKNAVILSAFGSVHGSRYTRCQIAIYPRRTCSSRIPPHRLTSSA